MRRYGPNNRPRLAGYDYAQANHYFVTNVAEHRVERFGAVDNGMMALNEAGSMVDLFWVGIPERYPAIALDLHVVMPDHVHGLISISCEYQERPKLGRVVQWFKTWTTNQYIDGVKSSGWTPFEGKLWQTGYYDHIGRGEADLERIRAYILQNPARRWQKMCEDSSD